MAVNRGQHRVIARPDAETKNLFFFPVHATISFQ